MWGVWHYLCGILRLCRTIPILEAKSPPFPMERLARCLILTSLTLQPIWTGADWWGAYSLWQLFQVVWVRNSPTCRPRWFSAAENGGAVIFPSSSLLHLSTPPSRGNWWCRWQMQSPPSWVINIWKKNRCKCLWCDKLFVSPLFIWGKTICIYSFMQTFSATKRAVQWECAVRWNHSEKKKKDFYVKMFGHTCFKLRFRFSLIFNKTRLVC